MRLLQGKWSRAGLAALLAISGVGTALAQYGEMKLDNQPPKGRYVMLPGKLFSDDAMVRMAASTGLQTWNGSYSYGGTNYTYNMVGAAPSANTTSTVQVYIIPVKLDITYRRQAYSFDPEATSAGDGKTVLQNTTASPLFDSTTDYTLGSVDVGKAQYIDAFQRANFWGTIRNYTGSHLVLGGPTVLTEQTLSVPSSYGKIGSPFGYQAGLVDINWFDAQLPTIMSKFSQINPSTFVIFLTTNVYLTQNGSCCIGGYHSSEGSASNPQSYAQASYIPHSGVFSQDVSALSHEIGEWADDPLTVNPNGNNTPCGILEVGDPLENTSNYGDHTYSLNGFAYHLQDLAMMPYFGAPASTSANGWYSFNNYSLSVCSNGS
jgi:hypothetical protein